MNTKCRECQKPIHKTNNEAICKFCEYKGGSDSFHMKCLKRIDGTPYCSKHYQIFKEDRFFFKYALKIGGFNVKTESIKMRNIKITINDIAINRNNKLSVEYYLSVSIANLLSKSAVIIVDITNHEEAVMSFKKQLAEWFRLYWHSHIDSITAAEQSVANAKMLAEKSKNAYKTVTTIYNIKE